MYPPCSVNVCIYNTEQATNMSTTFITLFNQSLGVFESMKAYKGYLELQTDWVLPF